MNARFNQRGFTIIETTLVVSIAALLAVAILVGSGLAISQQRYRDALATLQSVIQSQYSLANNVVNSRNGSQGCTADALELPNSGATDVPRGQSECIIVGRYLKIENGTDITAMNVLARRDPAAPMAANEIDELRTNYRFGLSETSQEKDVVAWGDAIYSPLPTHTRTTLAMLVIRSPQSGATMTFVQQALADSNLASMIQPANMVQYNVCLDPQGASIQGGQVGVRIAANATTQAGVSLMTPEEAKGICQ